MNKSTHSIIETVVCADESITPEQAGLIIHIINGTAKHLTTRETATVCGCCIATVRNWAGSGELMPCNKVTGTYQFSPSNVWKKILQRSEASR